MLLTVNNSIAWSLACFSKFVDITGTNENFTLLGKVKFKSFFEY